jgi:hypothetical protein
MALAIARAAKLAWRNGTVLPTLRTAQDQTHHDVINYAGICDTNIVLLTLPSVH